jgi:hypothetical protein
MRQDEFQAEIKAAYELDADDSKHFMKEMASIGCLSVKYSDFEGKHLRLARQGFKTKMITKFFAFESMRDSLILN